MWPFDDDTLLNLRKLDCRGEDVSWVVLLDAVLSTVVGRPNLLFCCATVFVVNGGTKNVGLECGPRGVLTLKTASL